jgi:hypothetical protein
MMFVLCSCWDVSAVLVLIIASFSMFSCPDSATSGSLKLMLIMYALVLRKVIEGVMGWARER